MVEVILNGGQVWVNSTDIRKRAHTNDWSKRSWRHLDSCQFEAIIKVRVLHSSIATLQSRYPADESLRS